MGFSIVRSCSILAIILVTVLNFLLLIKNRSSYDEIFDEDLKNILPPPQPASNQLQIPPSKQSVSSSPSKSELPSHVSASSAEFEEAVSNSKKRQVQGRIRMFSVNRPSFDQIRSGAKYRFNAGRNDVLVFLHIQKTSGTLIERALRRVNVFDVFPNKNCSAPDQCKRHWLFSRFTSGWPCGVHPDWTELVESNCVDRFLDSQNRMLKVPPRYRHFIFTVLRDPVHRYLSEWRHQSEEGSDWHVAMHACGGRLPTAEELPLCYDPTTTKWRGVTLDQFLACPYNLANNRQTRMLADLHLVGCYDTTKLSKEKRDILLLESAKRNLENMAFFGLQEDVQLTQYMIERTIGVKFNKSISLGGTQNETHSSKISTTPEQLERIKQVNHLDLELYEFAARLLQSRRRSVANGFYQMNHFDGELYIPRNELDKPNNGADKRPQYAAFKSHVQNGLKSFVAAITDKQNDTQKDNRKVNVIVEGGKSMKNGTKIDTGNVNPSNNNRSRKDQSSNIKKSSVHEKKIINSKTPPAANNGTSKSMKTPMKAENTHKNAAAASKEAELRIINKLDEQNHDQQNLSNFKLDEVDVENLKKNKKKL